MLRIWYGEDRFTLHEALARLRAELFPQGEEVGNATTLEGRGLTLEALRAVVDTVPFLATHRLVVVEGLLARFQEEVGRGKGRARGVEVAPWADYLSAIPPHAEVVLVDGPVEGGNPLLRALRAHAEVRRFPLPDRRELPQWVRRRAQAKGARLSPGAVRLLVDLVGQDLWALEGELEKLSLFAADRAVEEEDVRALVSSAREARVFEAVDAILEGDAGQASALVHRLAQQGMSPAYVMAMLARQVRLVLLARELLQERVPPGQMGRRLGVSSEFLLRKTLEQAGRHPRERLLRLYRLLLETDLAVKTGSLAQGLALEVLVARACARPTRI